jgi:hypothetical protein
MGRIDQRTEVEFDKDVTQEMGGRVMKMWICRDEDGLLHLEFTDKPPFKSIYERTVVWASNSEWGTVELDRTSYPEVTFENSPQEVELKLVNNVGEETD